MKNPSDTIEQNFEALATEMMDLQVCSSRVVRKEPKRMDEWLERKYSSTIDFVEIKREWNKLKGDHLNNLKTREALNCRVIDSLKAAIALKKVVQAIMELIETPSNEVKTVMKNPSDTIEQNLEALATEMMDLQFCSSRVVRKEPKLMEGWLLESKQSAVTDFVEIQREWNKLKGDHLNNLKTREALNCRVIDSLKAAIALRKVVQAIMELIETLSNEVKTGEPKQEAVTHSKKEKEKEISLTGEKGDKPKPEGVTLLKEVMENPIDTLDQNLEALATQIVALKFCSSRVVRKDPKRMEVWLESTQSVMNDFVEIRREWNKLKGDHLNNLKPRDALNCRVIDSLKAAIALKKVFQAIMELIGTLSNEVKTGEPKQEAVTHSKKEKEISLTGEKRDKPKPEGVTVLKEVMETSDLKIDKPIQITPKETFDLDGFLTKENRGRLVENWDVLSREIDALKKFRDEVSSKKAQQMASWLKDVEEKVDEFVALLYEFNEFKNGSLGARHKINRKVIDMLRSVHILKEVGNAVSDSIETLFSDLIGEKPKRYTHANLISFTSNFSNPIDRHRNGNVYKGHFPSRVEIVVKKLMEQDAVEDIFMAEMNTMFKTSHRNLVKLYGFCFEKNMKALVFEYMPNGSLDRILFDHHHGNLEWEKLYQIATETAKGLSYLHDGCDDQLLHRDLKASNVLLNSNMCPKVTNFGVSKLMSRDKTHITLSKVRGDPSYAAPEMTQSAPITNKCDVYTFGMMLLEVLGRRRNIQGKVYFPKLIWDKFEKRDVEGIIKECGIPEKSRENAMILCMVAFWCIQYTQENRPSMSIVVKMLEKEIKAMKPPNPFLPWKAYSVKPIVDVVYLPSDFERDIKSDSTRLATGGLTSSEASTH